MNFNAIDFGPLFATLGGLALLIVVDTVLGSMSAWQGGSFKWEYLYAVIQSKGAAFVRVAVLLVAGAATQFLDFSVLGLELDPFTAVGSGFAALLAASLAASIFDNIGKQDATAPQGVAPVAQPTPPDKT